jgi:lipoprotein-releasing system permease protein
MNLPYQLFIAIRYLRSKKKHKGISFNTAISIGGVAVGVMALLVVLSVMSGFHEDLQKKILGANSHAVVLSYKGAIRNYDMLMDEIKKDKRVVSAAPFVMGQALVSSGKNAHGVFVKGLDLQSSRKTTEILSHIKFGKLPDVPDKEGADEVPWILVGNELAGMLGVFTGETINIISPIGEMGPLGMMPRMKQFRVVAVFEMGMFEYDANLAIMSIKSAQDFFKYGDTVSGVEIKLTDIYDAPAVRSDLNKELGPPFFVKDWMMMNKNLFSALKLEKFAMFVVVLLIILVASFNIVSTLMMNVMEKQKEIAILKSMGAGNRGVMMIFMFQGLFIGIVGTVIGLVCATILCYVLNTYELIDLPASVYYLKTLPVKANVFDFILVSFSAVTISFLSTIYPSYYAARLNPVEPLRYE